MPRPHVLLSVAMSVDGYIDDAGPERLRLSNDVDFDRVDQVRAESDAILIGAGTIRRDNPLLIVNSSDRRARRRAAGQPEYPLKVTVTAGGNLDPESKFWHHGGEKLVYTTQTGAEKLRPILADLAVIVSLGSHVDFGTLLDDVGTRGVSRLMVEGGSHIHTALLSADLVDEMHVAVAPLIVGDRQAPRFLEPAEYPGGSKRRMHLADVVRIGDVALLRYLPDFRRAIAPGR